MKHLGDLFIISAPSGAGKTSLVRALVEAVPRLQISISYTTREARPHEQEGLDYHFVDQATFEEILAKGRFLEYAKVFHHYYGTSRDWVEKTLQAGQDVILEIDWQGAQQIRVLWPSSISIFIIPPSLTELSNRLNLRGRDKPGDIQHRLGVAQEEIRHFSEFDYLVCNDNFDRALEDLQSIIRAIRLSERRQAKTLAIELERLLSY